MRRIVCITLIFVILMFNLLASGVCALLTGDVNSDNELNNKDVVLLFRYVSDSNKADDETAYDYNNDGFVDNKDVVALFRFASLNENKPTPVSRGDDKSGTAFEIDSYDDLKLFATRVNGGETDLNAVLTADIAADEYKEWIPIGCDADHKYVGVFDGHGYKITDLSNANANPRPACAGLFGYIGAAGVVKNITVEDAKIENASTDSPGAIYLGAVAGYSEGTLINIIGQGNERTGGGNTVHANSGTVDGDFLFYTGGLVGYNTGTITDSCANGRGKISAESNKTSIIIISYVGGIAGYNGGSIGNCYGDFSGDIEAEVHNNAYVGGIAGYNDTGATVENCENRGSADITAGLKASGKNAAAGGIVGYNNGNIEKTFVSGSGDIQAKNVLFRKDNNYYAGALVGWNGPDAVITYCYNCGNATVSATGYRQPTCAGGMVGYNQGTIEKSYRSGSGDISANSSDGSYAGALAGCNDGSSAEILNCYNCGNGVITAATAAGGLVGCNYHSGTVQYAYHCGSDDISAATTGGVIGKNEGTATNCFYDRNVCAIGGATKENNWKAIGDGDGTNVTGLTTDSMTGENAKDTMNFAGEESPWYPGLQYESGGLSCDCYPHLYGFVYDTTKDLADWPPRGVYKIGSYEELKQFAETVNSGNASANAILTADILCNDNEWIPIGDGSGSGNAQIKYIGTFDGCGHTITGLSCTIDKSDPAESQSVCAGLFGYIGQGGIVKNIGIVNPKINANAISSNNELAKDTDVFAGAIAGLNDGKIQQCYLSGSGTVRGVGISPCVKNMNVDVGALAGKNEGTIQDCCNCGSTAVKAGFKLTDDCNITYDVDSKNEINAGGIVGYNSGSIKNCYNCSTGQITVTQSKRVVYVKEPEMIVYSREVLQSYAGAIAGSVSDDSAYENCYYDSWRCSSDSAVGNKEFAECKLTTEDMTKGTYITEYSETYVENMPGFSSEIWLVKESESGYYCYPHLKGFAYDTETTTDNWPPKVSELVSRNHSGDEAALCALTISSNKDVSYSDDEGVSITAAGKARIRIKAGTVLVLMHSNHNANDDVFIGWYSNGNLVSDSSVCEIIIYEDVEFEFRYRDENERIIKFVADLNGEKQIWEIVTCTINDDISFPKMSFYGFKLDGWKVSDQGYNDSDIPYTTEEAKNEVTNKLLTGSTTVIVEGVFSRIKEAENSGNPDLNGKYTVTVCQNDTVVERLFRDFDKSEYFTFNADEIEKYVDMTGKTFSHWLLDDVKISTNREVTFRVAKDCILNAVYVSDRSLSVKLTKVDTDNADNMKLEAEVNFENSDVIDSVTFRYQVAPEAITGKKDHRSYAYTATISDIDVDKMYTIQPVVIFNDGSAPMECEKETVTASAGAKVSEKTFLYSDGSLTVSVDQYKMTLKANTTDPSVEFKYKKGDGEWTKTDKYQIDDDLYEANIENITNGIYYIQLVVTVVANNESNQKIWIEEAVVVSGGMIVLPASYYQYDEASLITKMNVSMDNQGYMFITAAINSEIVAKVLKVRFKYREAMETTNEIAGAKDDVTGKYTADISGIDVNKVYSVQPVVTTINGEIVEGALVEALPKQGYDSSEKAYVDIVDMKRDDRNVIFTEHIFVPAGCIISRTGVLISVGSDKVSDASVLNTVTDVNEQIYNATIQAFSGKKVDERGLTCTYTWTKKNVDQSKSVYVLAYLVYFDEFNKQHIVCGIVKNMIP